MDEAGRQRRGRDGDPNRGPPRLQPRGQRDLFNPVYESLYRYEVGRTPRLNYNSAWSLQDLRYIPQNLGIMLGGLPDVMPACAAGMPREIWSVDGCWSIIPTGRDEPPAHQPGVARRGRRAADPARPTGGGRSPRNAGDRDRQPDAFLAGMGAVRLPVQPRLRAVPARASRAGGRAPAQADGAGALGALGILVGGLIGASVALQAGAWHGPGRWAGEWREPPGRSAVRPLSPPIWRAVRWWGSSRSGSLDRPCCRAWAVGHRRIPDRSVRCWARHIPRATRATSSWDGSRTCCWRRSASRPSG